MTHPTKAKKDVENSDLLNELGIFPDREKLQVVQSELGNAQTLKEKKQYDKNTSVSLNDYETFPFFLEKYIEHKKNYPSGVVSRTNEDKPLYRWFVKMRDFYALNILPKDFEKELSREEFPFGDAKEALRLWKWDRRFDELLDYMEIHKMKFAYVPQHKSNKHPYHSLGQWFAQQKQRKNNNYPPPITDYEMEKFSSVNFKWFSVNAGGLRDDDTWLENYFRLQEFKKIFNHANPSQTSKDPDTKKLAKWVNDQVTLHNTGKTNSKGEKKTLIKEREELLEELGVDWHWQLNKYKRKLEEQIEAYLEFRKVYPDEKQKNGDKRFDDVLEWKSLTRYRYKGDTLPENKWRMDILNSDRVKFPW